MTILKRFSSFLAQSRASYVNESCFDIILADTRLIPKSLVIMDWTDPQLICASDNSQMLHAHLRVWVSTNILSAILEMSKPFIHLWAVHTLHTLSVTLCRPLSRYSQAFWQNLMQIFNSSCHGQCDDHTQHMFLSRTAVNFYDFFKNPCYLLLTLTF